MDKEFFSLEEILEQFFPSPQCYGQWRWDRNTAENLVLDKIVHFKENGFCVQFHPLFSYGTAAVWGECELDALTRAYWEVAVDEMYGSSMMFGIGTRDGLQSVPLGFVDLIGGCGRHGDQSYGLSHKGSIFHACEGRPFCAQLHHATDSREQPCTRTVGILFDGPSTRIGFSLDGKWLGWAFHAVKLDDDRVYLPMVSSTAQRSSFKLLQHQQRQSRTPNALQQKCMDAIVGQMLRVRNTRLPSVGRLGLPKALECQLWRKWCARVMQRCDNEKPLPPIERSASTQTDEAAQRRSDEKHAADVDELNLLLDHSSSSRKRKCPQANTNRRRRSRHAAAAATAPGDLSHPQANPINEIPGHCIAQ